MSYYSSFILCLSLLSSSINTTSIFANQLANSWRTVGEQLANFMQVAMAFIRDVHVFFNFFFFYYTILDD